MTSQNPSRNHRSALSPQLTALVVSNYYVTKTFLSESGVVFSVPTMIQSDGFSVRVNSLSGGSYASVRVSLLPALIVYPHFAATFLNFLPFFLKTLLSFEVHRKYPVVLAVLVERDVRHEVHLPSHLHHPLVGVPHVEVPPLQVVLEGVVDQVVVVLVLAMGNQLAELAVLAFARELSPVSGFLEHGPSSVAPCLTHGSVGLRVYQPHCRVNQIALFIVHGFAVYYGEHIISVPVHSTFRLLFAELTTSVGKYHILFVPVVQRV